LFLIPIQQLPIMSNEYEQLPDVKRKPEQAKVTCPRCEGTGRLSDIPGQKREPIAQTVKVQVKLLSKTMPNLLSRLNS